MATEYEINLLALKKIGVEKCCFQLTEGQKATQETIGIEWGIVQERKIVDEKKKNIQPIPISDAPSRGVGLPIVLLRY